MKLFITGATGFVGSTLLSEAVQVGHRVSGLVRRADQASTISSRGGMPIRGDLRFPDAWSDHLAGVDALIHLGALIRFAGPMADFTEINVEPTRQLIRLAIAAGVKKFIYVSAAALALNGEPLDNITEKYQPRQRISSHYLDSKLLAEHAILPHRENIQVIIFRPPVIWGPGMNLIEEFRPTIERMGFPIIGDPQHHLATCHVKNLVAAILRALENDEAEGIFLISDAEHVPIQPFMHKIIRAYGMNPGRLQMPRWLAVACAKPMEWIWSGFSLPGSPPLSTLMAHLMGTEFTIDNTRIRRELGYHPVISVAEGLRQLSRQSFQSSRDYTEGS